LFDRNQGNTSQSCGGYGFQTQDFASSVVEAARRLRIGSFQFLPLEAEAFFPASLAPTGIADSVNRIVIGRSATLSPSLRQRVGELSDLQTNWDGETAKPVKAPVLGDAVEFLRRLSHRKRLSRNACPSIGRNTVMHQRQPMKIQLL
jgi:hypothetical protein